MGSFQVQGVVSRDNGNPFVQFRQLDDNDALEAGFQVTPQEAREIAQNILEASTNAIYDAALLAWVKETFPDDENMGFAMIAMIRKFRADKWGLPNNPEDWRNE